MKTKSRLRRFVEISLALVSGGLVALFLGEVLLRLKPSLLPEEAQRRLHWSELIAADKEAERSRADPEIGFLYPPRAEGVFFRADLRFRYTTDERGWRNPDGFPERADIVCVGDSLTFGYGVEDDESFPYNLNQALPQTVCNLGLIGAAPEQSRRILERFGYPLEPKLILFNVFPANDFFDQRTFTQWLDAGAPGNYDIWRFFGRNPSKGGLVEFLRKTYLGILAEHMLRQRRSSGEYEARTIEFDDGRKVQLAPSILAGATSGAQPGHDDFEGVLRSIEQAKKTADEHGVAFWVVLLPSKEEVYLPPMGHPCPDPATPLREALEQRGIKVIDLGPALREKVREPQPLYFEVDGHPNREGYAAMATALQAEIEKGF